MYKKHSWTSPYQSLLDTDLKNFWKEQIVQYLFLHVDRIMVTFKELKILKFISTLAEGIRSKVH